MSSYACVSSSSLLVHSSSNYDELIAQAWAAHDAGAQHLLVDLSDADWASIAGLLGRHTVASIAQGVQPPDRQAGEAAPGRTQPAPAGPPGAGARPVRRRSRHLS